LYLDFGICLSFGFWHLKFSLWDCHASLALTPFFLSLRGAEGDEAISLGTGDCHASLALTPFFLSLRGAEGDEAISGTTGTLNRRKCQNPNAKFTPSSHLGFELCHLSLFGI